MRVNMDNMDDRRIANPTRDRLIAAALLEDIVEWRIPPGSWIREREIAERFNVSHAPVREALRHVANVGFVQVVPWRGAHVIEIDGRAATEVFEIWKAMFGVVCRLAATQMSAEDGRELLRRLQDYKDIVRATGNTFEHLAVSNRIGTFIAWRCGGALARDMLGRVTLFARWQHHVISADHFDTFEVHPGLRSAELYEALCEAIVARDPDLADAAARMLLHHLQVYFEAPLDAYISRRAPMATPKRSRRKT